jgi:tetratricopeptide (TPR) repeat protein
VLPNTGLQISYSSLLWTYTDPRDERPWVAPHIAAELSSTDYATNRDPALQAVLEYKPITPLPDLLLEVSQAEGIEAAIARYREFKAEPAHKYADTEWDVHLWGRRLLFRKRLAEALRAFELNAAEHPRSFRVHQDLGDAYSRAEQWDRAVASYRRSLELNPASTDAQDALEKLSQRVETSR